MQLPQTSPLFLCSLQVAKSLQCFKVCFVGMVYFGPAGMHLTVRLHVYHNVRALAIISLSSGLATVH